MKLSLLTIIVAMACTQNVFATAKEAVAEKEKSLPKICVGLNNSIATIDKSAAKSGEAVKILYAIADSRLDKNKEMYPSEINQYRISKAELCKMVADAKKLNDESKESRQLASSEIDAAYRTLPGQPENKDLKKCDSKAKDEALELARALDSVMDEWSPLIVTLDQSFCSDRKPAFVKNKDQVECLKETETGPEKKAQSEAKIMLDVASKVKPKP